MKRTSTTILEIEVDNPLSYDHAEDGRYIWPERWKDVNERIAALEAENANLKNGLLPLRIDYVASKRELSELREAAAWYFECLDFWQDGLKMDNVFWLDQEYELDNSIGAASGALRALLKEEP